MEKHKIRNIDIDICCCEQKIAYNYLFSYVTCGMSENDIRWAKRIVYKDIYARKDMKRYYREYIFELFCDNLQKYIDENTPIFGTYEAIGKFFKEGRE